MPDTPASSVKDIANDMSTYPYAYAICNMNVGEVINYSYDSNSGVRWGEAPDYILNFGNISSDWTIEAPHFNNRSVNKIMSYRTDEELAKSIFGHQIDTFNLETRYYDSSYGGNRTLYSGAVFRDGVLISGAWYIGRN